MTEKLVLLVDADGDTEGFVRESAARVHREVILAKTSRDAFRVLELRMWRLDLVVIDVDPGIHGLALLEAISGCTEHPPMIVLTALEEAYMEPIAREHGAIGCLGKPITLARLEAVLKRAAHQTPTCDRWGSVVPAESHRATEFKTAFRGIAEKLSPSTRDPANWIRQ